MCNTLRVCNKSLIIFKGSDNAAKTTGVWISSDIEVRKTLENLLISSTKLGAMGPLKLDSSSWLMTVLQSSRVCSHSNLVKLNDNNLYVKDIWASYIWYRNNQVGGLKRLDILFISVAVVLYLLKQRDVIMCTVYPYSWKCLLSHDSSCNNCINMLSRHIE